LALAFGSSTGLDDLGRMDDLSGSLQANPGDSVMEVAWGNRAGNCWRSRVPGGQRHALQWPAGVGGHDIAGIPFSGVVPDAVQRTINQQARTGTGLGWFVRLARQSLSLGNRGCRHWFGLAGPAEYPSRRSGVAVPP